MKFSVGYQLCSDSEFVDEIIKNRDSIYEVYFSWSDYANGRNSQIRKSGLTPWEAQRYIEEDIKRISDAGIKLNVLFNAMCYGENSQSRSFFEGIGNTLEYLLANYNLASLTTTSLLVAKFVKENFPMLDVRASVNMDIGTVEGLDYVKEYFDSFYIRRELNRDFGEIRKLKSWCDENGKTLYALANSGCLNYCSAHVFHDNLVAHEAEISKMDNGYNFEGVCRSYFKNPENHFALSQRLGYIRPEDTELYEGIFPALKLATRVSKNPAKILKAYIRGKHSGSTLDLLEPNHSGVIYPYLLENSKIISQVKNEKLTYNIENALIKLEGELC